MIEADATKGGVNMSNETKAIAPKELAAEIGIDPKRLRAYLRANAPRPAEAKNTSWAIAADVADAARLHFAPKEEATTDEVEA
jgi:hypothetical protein